VPKAATAAEVALYVKQSGHTAFILRSVPVSQTFTCDQTAIRSPGLPINGLHPRNPCNRIDYYLFTDPEGMEG